MKNILLPTDFSENSKNAVDYALQLFKNELCTFYFLNVQKVSNYISDDLMVAPADTNIYQSVVFNAKKELKAYVNTVRVKHKNDAHIYKVLVDYDSLTDAINQVINSKKIDLIIMGTNGATSAREVIFGSNTLKVLRKVNCPTITIPDNYNYKEPKNILFLEHSENKYTSKILEPLMDLSVKFNSELLFLKTEAEDKWNATQKAFSEKIKAVFSTFKNETKTIINVPIPEAIDSIVQLIDINLVCVLLKKETFINRLISGSITDDLNYNSRVPLLFFHENE